MNNNNFVKCQFENELLNNILPFWMTVAPDKKNGGFYGHVSIDKSINNDVPRTSVTCSRILWTFSHAYLIYKREEYLHIAKRAFDYLNSFFWDKEYDGLYWSVDLHGKPAFDHKHSYAQAFGIYGYSEYFRATADEKSLMRAIRIFNLLEEHAFDPQHGGYIEGNSREFRALPDMRLSDKDMNCRKSMNTLLHIIEAYTNLSRIWDNQVLRNQLYKLTSDFKTHVIDKNSTHFSLFFDDEWISLSDRISCGHEIEGSWLIHEAAEILGNQEFLKEIREISLRLAESVFTSGINKDGSIIQEGTVERITNPNKEWWPQAEAVIGFYNAYQLSGEMKYLNASNTCWNYIIDNFVDKTNGGWFKRLQKDGTIDLSSPKIGPWECSYHESRLCFEMMNRLSNHKEK